MLICSMIILFALCSFIGWLFETLFAIVKTRTWESRGFLYGPVCPIYGVGVVAIALAAKGVARFAAVQYEWVHVAVFAFFGSMVLEYVVSWALEKLFHAYWWDYSDMPLNIRGRTCVPAALLFSLGGLAAVYLVSPAWDAIMMQLPFVAVEIVAFLVVVLFTVDTTLTISALTNFQSQVMHAEERFNSHATALTEKVTSVGPEAAERLLAERERLKEMSIQQIADDMSSIARKALRRVDGLRAASRPTKAGVHEWASKALSLLKQSRR